MSIMQTSLDTTASMNSIGYCESIDGFVVPLVLGEAIDSFAHNSGDDVGDFSTTVGSYPRFCSVVDSFPLIRSICTVANGRYDRNGITNSGTSCGTDYISGAAGEGIWKSSIVNAPEVDGTVIWRRGGVVQPVQLEGSCSRLPCEPTMSRHQGLNCDSSGFSLFSEELSFNVENRNCTREQGLEISSSSRAMFLQAMQEILAEIALHTFEGTGNEDGSSKCHQEHDSADNIDPYDDTLVLQDRHHVEIKKKHLLALLQLVNDGYAQCLHEIHMVSSAFHVVTELDPNLHARFALRTISLMYKNLRERISSHIVPTGAHLAKGQPLQESEQSNTSTLWPAEQRWVFHQQLGKRDRHLWRPQRGLPEQSVSVLRTWMFQNFLHPYPKDGDKQLLALKSGLTRNQVSNWFINARVRLWKPMIEEMYAELNKTKQFSK